MMSNEGYRDRILTCRDCGNDFTFTTGEQEFYANKGLTNTPSRCPSCRALRRGGQSNSGSRAPRGEQYDVICASCGRPTSVPFIPREDRPVYCSDCFQAQRASRPRRDDFNNYGGSINGGGYDGGRGVTAVTVAATDATAVGKKRLRLDKRVISIDGLPSRFFF